MDEPPDRCTYDPSSPAPTLGGALLVSPEYPPGPYDRLPIEARDDVLTSTTPPFRHDTEVTGPVRVHLWATLSASDTNFVTRLTDVFLDGRSYNPMEAWAGSSCIRTPGTCVSRRRDSHTLHSMGTDSEVGDKQASRSPWQGSNP
jgi:predicted acyl esterase